jgi:hypothetical protein
MAVQETEELQVSKTKRAIELRRALVPRTVIVDGLMNMTFPTLNSRDGIGGPTKVPDCHQYGRYE